MKRTRLPEEKILQLLKEVERANPLHRFADPTALQPLRIIVGKPNTKA